MNIRRPARSQANIAIAGVIGIGVFFALWEIVVRWLDISPSILQAPSEIVAAFVKEPSTYLAAAWVTLWHTVVGTTIALALSFFVGGLLAASRFLEDASQPILIMILVTPWVAYFSSLINWLGGGTEPVLFLVAFVTFPGYVFAMVSGLRSADPNVVELFVSVDASRWETLWRLRLPSALPTVFAAARLNTGLALAAGYFAEGKNLTGGGSLGSIGATASAYPAQGRAALWVTILLAAALGALLLAGITVLERVTLRWHSSQRQLTT